MNLLPQQKHSTSSMIATFLALMGFAISAAMLPPLFTTISKDIGVSFSLFGQVMMLQFFCYFLTGLVGGWVSEHFHIRSRSIILAGLLLVAITIGIESRLDSLTGFILLAIPMGIGGGMISIFSSILIAQREKPHSSKLTTLSQIFLAMGAITSPMLIAGLLGHFISWRIIFGACSLFMFILFIVFFLLTRDLSGPVSDHSSPPKTHSGSLLKDSLFILMAGSLFAYVAFESLLTCWLAVYFEKGLFCSVESSALMISVYWFGLIMGRLATTLWPNHLTLWRVIFTGFSICFVMIILAAIFRRPIWVGIFVFASGVGAGPLWPNMVAICQATRNRPRFTSAVIAFGALGVTAGSGMGSVIFKHFPTLWFFPIVGIGALVFLVLITLAYRNSRSTQN